MIELRDIAFSYGELKALESLDLDIGRGESVLFIGENGSGKSTLLKILAGAIHPTGGSYRFEGASISRESLKDPLFAKRFHQRVGFLFQNSETQLFCPSLAEEIAFGPRQMGLPEEEVAGRVHDCAAMLGLESLLDRPPYALSGGEKKKAALASILSLNPEVLALDEPMNGLDPRTKSFLRDFLVALKAAGKTILCSTHDFSYVEGVFGKVVVISGEHRIVREAPCAEVMSDVDFLRASNII